jgi:hypothetical protein
MHCKAQRAYHPFREGVKNPEDSIPTASGARTVIRTVLAEKLGSHVLTSTIISSVGWFQDGSLTSARGKIAVRASAQCSNQSPFKFHVWVRLELESLSDVELAREEAETPSPDQQTSVNLRIGHYVSPTSRDSSTTNHNDRSIERGCGISPG